MKEATAPRAARGSLSIEAIELAALRIADEEGLEALTLRRLAAELNVGAMSLYRHVRNKEELVERLTERAIDELEIPQDGAWHEQLEQLFFNVHELLARHPAVLYADTSRPLAGPGAMRAADAALGLLRAGGLDGPAAVTGMSVLVAYTFGAAIFQLNKAGIGRRRYAEQVRGTDPDDMPNVAGLTDEMLQRGSEQEFAAGLRLIIDGLVRQAEEPS